MTFLVTLHDGGGSMVEGADPVHTWSAPDLASATAIEAAVSAHLQQLGNPDLWTQVIEVPSIQASASGAVADVTGSYGAPGSAMAGGMNMNAPSMDTCPNCGQQIPTSNGLLMTHDISPQMRQVCPGSGTPAPSAALNSFLSQMGPAGQQISAAMGGPLGGMQAPPLHFPNPEEEEKKREAEKAERKAAIEKAKKAQKAFDEEMAEEYPSGLYLVAGLPVTDDGPPPHVIDYKTGVALDLSIRRKQIHLRYNPDDPTDPYNGKPIPVEVYIDGTRRQGRPSEVVQEIRQAIPKVDAIALSEEGGSRKVALKYKEQRERLERLTTAEPTDEIPEDVAAILARLQGKQLETVPAGPQTHTVTVTPEAMAALSDTQKCDCCGQERLSLPFHHDAHDDSGESWDYCQRCYDAGCSVNDPTGGCVL